MLHCAKSVGIPIYSVQMWEIRTRITPNTDTLHVVLASNVDFRLRSQYDLNSLYV